MATMMRKVQAAHIPVRDIGVLIATSPRPQGLARRKRIWPCRPWAWLPARANAHSIAHQPAV
ncbi:protein GbcA [Pseudomonas sp. BRM28]|nr:protein GbcA [Pseudomonas sp. BRM28]